MAFKFINLVQLTGSEQNAFQILHAILFSPEKLENTEFKNLSASHKLAAVRLAHNNKKRLQEKSDYETLLKIDFKFSSLMGAGIRKHQAWRSNAERIVVKLGLIETGLFPFVEKSISQVNENLKTEEELPPPSTKKIEFYQQRLEGLSPDLSLLLFKSILTRSNDSHDKAKLSGRGLEEKLDIICICLSKLSQYKNFRQQLLQNFMANNIAWKTAKENFAGFISKVLPDPEDPNFQFELEFARQKYSKKVLALIKNEKQKHRQAASEDLDFNVTEVKPKSPLILPGIETHKIQRTVRAVTHLNDFVADDLIDSEPNHLDAKYQKHEMPAVPDPRYRETLDTNVSPSFGWGIRKNLLNSVPVPADQYFPKGHKNEQKTTEVKIRLEAQRFRETVLDLYDSACCVSGCKVLEVLEAAHIEDYAVSKNNDWNNGLCLRVDIHRLYDKGLLKIDKNFMVHLHQDLINTEYRDYQFKKIKLPKQELYFPDRKLLDWKFNQ
jgi:hypothetical protein